MPINDGVINSPKSSRVAAIECPVTTEAAVTRATTSESGYLPTDIYSFPPNPAFSRRVLQPLPPLLASTYFRSSEKMIPCMWPPSPKWDYDLKHHKLMPQNWIESENSLRHPSRTACAPTNAGDLQA